MENKEVSYEEAYDEFVSRYEKTNPFTLSVNTQQIGMVWYYSVLVAVMVFASIRTSWSLVDASVQEGIPEFWAWVSSIVGVYGVEGFIAIYGIFRQRKLNPAGFERVLQEHSATISVLLGLVISLSAGLKFSLNVSEFLASTFGSSVSVILSLFTGVGFSFIIFGVGEFIGHQKWLRENLPSIEKQEYMRGLRDAWESSPLYATVTANEQIKAKVLEFDTTHATRGRARMWQERNKAGVQNVQLNTLNTKSNSSPASSPAFDKAWDYIDTYQGNVDNLPIRATAKLLGISPGTVSTARKTYLESRENGKS